MSTVEEKKTEASQILHTCLSENNKELDKIMSKNTEPIEKQLLLISTAIVAISSELAHIKEIVETNNSNNIEFQKLVVSKSDTTEARLSMIQAVVDGYMEAINGDVHVLPTAKGGTKVISDAPKAKRTTKKATVSADVKDEVVKDEVAKEEVAKDEVAKDEVAVAKPAKKAPAKKAVSLTVKKSNFLQLHIKDKKFINNILNSEHLELFTELFKNTAKIDISTIDQLESKIDEIIKFTNENDSAALQKSLNANKLFKEFIEQEYNMFVSNQSILNDKGYLEHEA